MRKFSPRAFLLATVFGLVGTGAANAQPANSMNRSGGNAVKVIARHNLNNVGDGVNVTDPAFGVANDCKMGFPLATFAHNTTALTAYTQSSQVTTVAGQTGVSYQNGIANLGVHFQPDEVGMTLAVAGVTWGGGKPVTTIASYISGTQVDTTDTADQTKTLAPNTQMIWPAFESTDVGKVIRIDESIKDPQLGGGSANLQAYVPWVTSIATVVSPFSITVNATGTVQASGTVSTGDVLNLIFTSANIVGSPVTVSYTTLAGDTINQGAIGLANAINANAAIVAAGVVAVADTGWVYFQYPGSQAITVTKSVTGTTSLQVVQQMGFGTGTNNNLPDVTTRPTRIWWGTEDTPGLILAANAAVAEPGRTDGAYRLFFPKGGYCAFQMSTVGNVVNGRASHNGLPLMAETLYVGEDGAEAGFTDLQGMPWPVTIVPRKAPTPPAPAKTISAQGFKRIARTNNPVVVGFGASKCSDLGGGTLLADTSTLQLLQEQLIHSNPSKNFPTPISRCIGGNPWQAQDTIPIVGGFPEWYATHTNSWFSYVSPVTPIQNGATGVVPDLVALFGNGSNDGSSISDQSVQSVIAKTEALAVDAYGNPPDIMLETEGTSAMYKADASGTYQGGFMSTQTGLDLASGLLESTANFYGYNYLDMGTEIKLAQWGHSRHTDAMRQIPDHPAVAVTDNQNYWINDWTDNFSVQLLLGTGTTTGTQFWNSGATKVNIQVSPRRDNVLQIGVDPSGNVTVQENVWGGNCTAPVSITNGSGSLTVGTTGQTTSSLSHNVSNAGENFASDGFLFITGGPTTLTPGTPIVYGNSTNPANYTNIDGGAYRSFIVDKSSASNYLVTNQPYQTYSAKTQNITYGGCPFMADDAAGKIDIQIPGAGVAGAQLNGKITAYSDINDVTVSPAASTTLSAVSKTLFLGHIAIPETGTAGINAAGSFSSNLVANPDTGVQPLLYVIVKDNMLYVGYQRASDLAFSQPIQTIYRGPLIRYGGPFYPRIWLTGSGGQTIQATRVFTSYPIMYQRKFTGRQIFGTPDGFDYLAAGEFTELNISGLWKDVIGSQDMAAPVVGQEQQFSWGATTIATAATDYTVPGAIGSNNGFTAYITTPGVFKNLFVRTANSPGAGNTVTYTLYVGAAGAPASTVLTCQISGTPANTCSDTTHSVAVTAGQVWTIQGVSSASATGTGQQSFGLEFDN